MQMFEISAIARVKISLARPDPDQNGPNKEMEAAMEFYQLLTSL